MIFEVFEENTPKKPKPIKLRLLCGTGTEGDVLLAVVNNSGNIEHRGEILRIQPNGTIRLMRAVKRAVNPEFGFQLDANDIVKLDKYSLFC